MSITKTGEPGMPCRSEWWARSKCCHAKVFVCDTSTKLGFFACEQCDLRGVPLAQATLFERNTKQPCEGDEAVARPHTSLHRVAGDCRRVVLCKSTNHSWWKNGQVFRVAADPHTIFTPVELWDARDFKVTKYAQE